MRKIEIALYKFDELSEESKQKAIDRLSDINVDGVWYDYIIDDAVNAVGLQIRDVYQDRDDKWTFKAVHLLSVKESMNKILSNVGKKDSLYAIAKRYSDLLVTYSIKRDHEYRQAIENYYKSLFEHSYSYLTSEEAIVETIKASDYEFYKNGALY